MSLFECTGCHCVENSALGWYWGRAEPKCVECMTGKWHGRFPKRSAVGMLIDQSGGLWTQEQVDAKMLPINYRIVGKVAKPTT